VIEICPGLEMHLKRFSDDISEFGDVCHQQLRLEEEPNQLLPEKDWRSHELCVLVQGTAECNCQGSKAAIDHHKIKIHKSLEFFFIC
jgi:hypothetical protein